METFGKNSRFSRRIWPDWGNTAWADMAGLGSIGLSREGMDQTCIINVNWDVIM